MRADTMLGRVVLALARDTAAFRPRHQHASNPIRRTMAMVSRSTPAFHSSDPVPTVEAAPASSPAIRARAMVDGLDLLRLRLARTWTSLTYSERARHGVAIVISGLVLGSLALMNVSGTRFTSPYHQSATSVAFSGPVTIDGNGIDFDVVPPRPGGNIFAIYGGLEATYEFISEWVNERPPTPADCFAQAANHPTTNIAALHAGSQVCAITSDRRIVYLRVDSSLPERIEAHVIVWK